MDRQEHKRTDAPAAIAAGRRPSGPSEEAAMLTEFTSATAVTPARPAAQGQPRPASPTDGATVPPVAPERLTRQAVEPS
jgi:hypothetical protein